MEVFTSSGHQQVKSEIQKSLSIYQLCVNLSTLSLIFILLFSYINCSIIIQQDNYVFTTEGLLEVAIESRKLA